MSRDALIVGINSYDRLPKLRSPAADADAIAQRLVQYGDFRVRRLPEIVNSDGSLGVGRTSKVFLTQLEEALVQLFKPEGTNIPDTALLFFSGHGLRKDRGVQEGFLATSEVDPEVGFYGLSLQWLRRLLQESPIRQQVVWLDCCHSGELLNVDQADPGDRGRGRDRCFIAASREYEFAYEETTGNHSVLTSALLQGLDPTRRADGQITNFSLTEHIQDALRSATQCPLFANSGNKIILTGRQVEASQPALEGICPYKGLEPFDCNDRDPSYFYGRTALTDALLEKVREGSFLAVVGASGSGKSSVVRAGLIYQLKQGQRLSGSDTWDIHILRPGEHPLQNLAEAFLDPALTGIDRADQLRKAQSLINTGSVGLGQLVRAATGDRVVLVIDQFEECFTLCRDSVERQHFFECLLGNTNQLLDPHDAHPHTPVPQRTSKLCIILTLRADFLGKCLEQDYSGLAKQIERHMVAVTPLTRDELEQAIAEPARQVGLEVESELVAQMITDVEGSPGSLPLLQYTLTELWQRRSVNWLTFAAYTQLGGVRGALQQQAEAVYNALPPQEQAIAKRIFLELTQLGEGTEDTRRQVPKRELMSLQQPAELVDRVIARLSAARLIVTTQLTEKSQTSGRVDVVDVAHEALIRHWFRLRQWVEENRAALRQKRDIEAIAEEWLEKGKPGELAYLLQGSKLRSAEEFSAQYAETVPLSSLAQELIHVSQTERDRLLSQERRRKRWRLGITLAFPLIIAASALLVALREQQSKRTLETVFLDTNTTETLDQLPTFLKRADAYRRHIDRLGETRDSEAAIAYYEQHKSEIDQVFAYYRQLLRVAGKLNQQIEENPEQFSRSLKQGQTLQSVSQTINTVLTEAEAAQAALLLTYRIPYVERYLSIQPEPQFGQIQITETSRRTDFENLFTEGALRSTYELLMRSSGAGADLNNDGFILDRQEANQLPCETLRELERLWRKATQQQCGWYGDESPDYDSDCLALDVNFSTLTLAVFDAPTDFVAERLKFCNISPSALSTALSN